jgi:hypothetical protein
VPTNTPLPPAKLLLTVRGSIQALHPATLLVTVRENRNHHTVAGATVTLNGTSVGIAKPLAAKTSKSGIATFRNVSARKPGTIKFSAAKHGYKKGSASIQVTS